MADDNSVHTADIKTNKTLVNVILDRSGSMAAIQDSTISGYNEYLKSLKADKDTEYSVTMIQFDSPIGGPELTVKYTDKPLADVPDLTMNDYVPRGMTPLYDAIGECVRRVKTDGRSVLTVIITDGQENASKEFTLESIKALIKNKEDREHWTFAFLGTGIDSYGIGGGMGISTSATANYASDPQSVHAMYSSLAQSTVTRSHVAASSGLHAAKCMSFFSGDQKVAMGDTATTDPSSVVIPVTQTGAGQPSQGGQAVPPPFRPHTGAVHRGTTRTLWNVSGD